MNEGVNRQLNGFAMNNDGVLRAPSSLYRLILQILALEVLEGVLLVLRLYLEGNDVCGLFI